MTIKNLQAHKKITRKDLVRKDYIHKLVQNLIFPNASNDYDISQDSPTSSLANMTVRNRSYLKIEVKEKKTIFQEQPRGQKSTHYIRDVPLPQAMHS